MGSGKRAKARRRVASAGPDPNDNLTPAGCEKTNRTRREVAPHSIEELARVDPSLLTFHLAARSKARASLLAASGRVPTAAWRGGFAIAAADMALETLKAPWFREEVAPTTPKERIWLSELREGLDVYGRIVWCLRFGYIYAAAALARRYVERWTYNLAFSYEIDRPEGLTDVEYFRHVWGPATRSSR